MRTRYPASCVFPAIALALAGMADGAPNPNFHVYLAFGQSNMEGAVNAPEAQDKEVNPRFLELPTVTCSNGSRKLTQGTWTPAIAPIVRCDTKISVVDWFGRTLADSLPKSDTIGLVVVAVGGAKIEGFDVDKCQAYYASAASWLQSFAANYGSNPYARLVSVAKEAQKRGVVKGVLLHQGESNTGDRAWAGEVKKIYQMLLSDLGLQASQVPLLVGEVAPTGSSKGANAMIDTIPRVIPTAHVVSASGLATTNADGQNVHFDAPSYRTLGKRYAQTMLGILKTTSVSPRTAIAPAAAITGDVVVHDVSGASVARFHVDAGANVQDGWNGVRRNLPAGVYWIRGVASPEAMRVFNGR